MPSLLFLVSAFGMGASSAPAVPLVNYDYWVQPKVDTTGTFSTDVDPDQGDTPTPLTTDIGPT